MGSIRDRLNDAIFARVAGPQGTMHRDRIHGTPGPRWFPSGSPIMRVHGDASMYVGGLRAVLLQTLNAAGVHTPFRLHGIPQEFLGHAKRDAILERIGLTGQTLARSIVEDMTSLSDGRSPLDVEHTP